MTSYVFEGKPDRCGLSYVTDSADQIIMGCVRADWLSRLGLLQGGKSIACYLDVSLLNVAFFHKLVNRSKNSPQSEKFASISTLIGRLSWGPPRAQDAIILITAFDGPCCQTVAILKRPVADCNSVS